MTFAEIFAEVKAGRKFRKKGSTQWLSAADVPTIFDSEFELEPKRVTITLDDFMVAYKKAAEESFALLPDGKTGGTVVPDGAYIAKLLGLV